MKKNRKAQFQGSKSNARKQAFKKREEKRRQNNMLPVVVNSSASLLVPMPENMMRVPVLNAMINPMPLTASNFTFEDKMPIILVGD